MGNPKQKWTPEEEEALRAGVAKHGAGKWKNIQKDPEFNHLLHSRSNIDLKDKWRNLNVSANAQGGPRDKSRTPKLKANPDVLPLAMVPCAPTTHATPTPLLLEAKEATAEDNTKCLLDGKTASKYNGMVYEALSTLKDPKGCDLSTIIKFIEQRHEVPQNFRRILSSRLRKLVHQEKLEKIQNCYRIKKEFLHGASPSPSKTPTPARAPIPKLDSKSKEEVQPITTYIGSTIEEAAIEAAYRIVEAENKSFVAAEAVKEAERVSRMAEDSDCLLQLAKDIYEKCARGEIVLLA